VQTREVVQTCKLSIRTSGCSSDGYGERWTNFTINHLSLALVILFFFSKWPPPPNPQRLVERSRLQSRASLWLHAVARPLQIAGCCWRWRTPVKIAGRRTHLLGRCQGLIIACSPRWGRRSPPRCCPRTRTVPLAVATLHAVVSFSYKTFILTFILTLITAWFFLSAKIHWYFRNFPSIHRVR
jgi:hypothetical protein